LLEVLQPLQSVSNDVDFTLRRLDLLRGLFLEGVHDPEVISDPDGINRPIGIASMRQRDLVNAPSSPFIGLTVSAICPAAAISRANLICSCTACGKEPNSFNAARTQEMRLIA
jgi:hypothetical protein